VPVGMTERIERPIQAYWIVKRWHPDGKTEWLADSMGGWTTERNYARLHYEHLKPDVVAETNHAALYPWCVGDLMWEYSVERVVG